MSVNKHIEKKVEDALASLDGVERATPAPWLYSRVNARLQQEVKTSWVRWGQLISRPSIAIACVLSILVVNVVILVRQPKVTVEQVAAENEYVIASNSSFDYEKILQP